VLPPDNSERDEPFPSCFRLPLHFYTFRRASPDDFPIQSMPVVEPMPVVVEDIEQSRSAPSIRQTILNGG
jgi:hypothetical protein